MLATVVLYDLEHLFQAHDRHRLDVASLAQPGGQQPAGEVFLIGCHLAQGQALALLRDKMPIQALVGIERKYRFAALLVIERSEKPGSALGHERGSMDVVRTGLVSAAIDPAKHTGSCKCGGRTEERSAFHRHEFP